MTKYFIDTEFIENGRTIDLISIGIVDEKGREYYACNDDCDLSKANQWVRENVISQLPSKHIGVNPSDPFTSPSVKQDILTWKTANQIKREIVEFVNAVNPPSSSIDKPSFWAYYADYDWVVFCQLFGTMMDLPKGFPMYCRDIKQECDRLGNPKLPEQKEGQHNALEDARWNKRALKFLKDYEKSLLSQAISQ